MRSLRETINKLAKGERESDKEGYGGDATGKAFRKHVLILLRDIRNSLENIENKDDFKPLKKAIKTNNVIFRNLTNVLRRLTPDYLAEEKNGK